MPAPWDPTSTPSGLGRVAGPASRRGLRVLQPDARRPNNPTRAQALQNGQGRTLTSDEYREALVNYLPQYYEDGMPLEIVMQGLFAASPAHPDRYGLPPCRAGGDNANHLVFDCARHTLQLYGDGRPAICDGLGPDFVNMPPVTSDDPACETLPLREVLATGSPYMKLMDLRCGQFHAANPECAACPYLRVCGGGCRAVAFDNRDSLPGKDPSTCSFFKDGWARKVVETMHRIQPEATSPYAKDPLFMGRKSSTTIAVTQAPCCADSA